MKKITITLMLLLASLPGLLWAQCNPQFTWSAAPSGNNLLRATFTNTTSYTVTPNVNHYFSMEFGDNSGTTFFNTTADHDYAAPGTYSAKFRLVKWDSLTQQPICVDSIIQQVTVAYTPCATTITKVNNGGGSYTFTAITPVGTSGMSYSWDFGDGNTGSGSSVTHTYTASGNYAVTLQATGGGCTYTNITNSEYIAPDCDSLFIGFVYTLSGLSVNFGNTSTAFPGVSNVANWDFGDGNSSTATNPNHTYAAPGSYAVKLINQWLDSASWALVCSDTIIQTVTVGNPAANVISGTIFWDSLAAPMPDTFKVWLIVHDSAANTLTAIDSAYVSPFYAYYAFYGHTSGSYRVKAAALGQTVSSLGWVPTYHDSSLYWGGATVIAHSGGNMTNRNVYMQSGTVTAGPGFIGGNISLGAGKGTATGVPDMLVLLRKNNNEVLAATYTDEDGNYRFDNVSVGSYNVYPESINYATIPSSAITISTGNASSASNNFEQTDNEIRPLTTLSIKELNQADGIIAYPNPVSDILFLESKNNHFNQVSVLNILGQTVLQQSLKAGINKVEMTALRSGVYYVLIKGADTARSMKITKR